MYLFYFVNFIRLYIEKYLVFVHRYLHLSLPFFQNYTEVNFVTITLHVFIVHTNILKLVKINKLLEILCIYVFI